MGRKVITKATVTEMLEAGQREYQLTDSDIVTALGKEYAQERGLRLIPAGSAPAAAAASTAAAQAGAEATAAEIRRRIVEALGYEPEGLDGAIRRGLQ